LSIEIVREYFEQYGLADQIIETAVSSATVELAAQALGTAPARICKTLSFRKASGGAILICAAGDTRVDNKAFRELFGEKARMLSAEEVLAFTGHEIGGVCPFGISRDDVFVYADKSLQRFETVFPACGNGNSAIELTPADLFKYDKALEWAEVCRIPHGDE
jgi:prolyl-tRNA editing enzyme YbaK/EbsC (Cys-tRNA(Pro) deacylase)